MAEGLSHLTLIVSDLDRTEEMLVTVLKARKIYDSGEVTFSRSRERFFDIGGVWVATMEGAPLDARTYNHIAFRMDDGDFDDRLRRIQSLGLEVLDDRPRVPGEGRSIYFYDADNHLFELHSGTLEARLRRYAEG